ncbi:hypothetical protein D9M72_630320 [compost metagenome]
MLFCDLALRLFSCTLLLGGLTVGFFLCRTLLFFGYPTVFLFGCALLFCSLAAGFLCFPFHFFRLLLAERLIVGRLFTAILREDDWRSRRFCFNRLHHDGC